MLTALGELERNQKVWRYMSYARFVWLLQERSLWLLRADHLGDPWEISLSGDQLDHVIRRHPITPIAEPPRESAMDRSERIIKGWRRKTYASCWSASEHESHALWRIYCPTPEGVAIQTTLAKLQASVGDLPIYKVTYGMPGAAKQTPQLEELATNKRPMFAYEHEVRIIHLADSDAPTPPVGFGLPWDPEQTIESIRAYPGAGSSFMDTVKATVRTYAPPLTRAVVWSDMNAYPPF
jgi:hypothetical protein